MSQNAIPSDPRYPVGKFRAPETISAEDREYWLTNLSELPGELRSAVDGWDSEKLNTPYREGGWTVCQLVHHIADSHMNAFCRTKLALTEDWPTITPYDEAKWAETADVKSAPVEWSLEIIESLHARWAMLLLSLTPGDWLRGYMHPEMGPMTLERVLALYAWHGRHHTAHITHLSQRLDW